MMKIYSKTLFAKICTMVFFVSLFVFLFIINENKSAYAQNESDNNNIYEQSLFTNNKQDAGVDMNLILQQDLNDVHYIQNANYFIANPQHANQIDEYNVAGTCTTVAMQILLGYHNYYSDRRIIPQYSENNIKFLSDNYGDIYQSPIINPHCSTDGDNKKNPKQYGRAAIGMTIIRNRNRNMA